MKKLALLVALSTLIATVLYWRQLAVRIAPDALLPDGSRYQGQIVNGRFEGRGQLLFGNGDIYEGGFVNGLMQGRGQLKFANGDVYIGEFHRGNFHGKGELHEHSGDLYVGDFVQGRVSGHGTLSTRDGRVYSGEFESGAFSGQGEYTLKNNGRYAGRFEHDVLVEGEFSNEFGERYQGHFKDWLLHGPGSYTSEEGDVYTGTFEQGMINGEGEIQYANGDHYRGNISFLFEEGHGTLRYANGDVYEGEFSSDSQHGKGVLIFANNEKDEQDKKGEKGESRIEGTWSWGDNPDDSRQKKQQKIATEERFYQQPALIQQRLSALAPEQAGQVDIYALTLAGDASSPVFLKELRLINTHLHTAGIDTEHLINLANDNETAEMWPMANGSALSRVLSGLAERMNPDEDVLLLYMTSHGSAQHALHIDTPGADSPNISAQRLANMLDTLPLKHTILIISACYSGGFIDQLKNDDNLVISAARHDRKSFGCGDDNDMTYFGRAYFAHGIGQGLGFVAAFHNATQLVEEWEDKNFPDQPHSEPQIHVGEKMRALLEKQKRL